MSFWPFGRRPKRAQQEQQSGGPPVVVPFPSDTFELPQAKYHGLRVLCGLLMDRQSSCQQQHPFCGPPPGPEENSQITTIAYATSQQDAVNGDPVIALYLCRAIRAPKYTNPEDAIDPLEYVAMLTPRDTVPNNKLVVNLLDDGHYTGEFGLISNPVEGDYSTGRIDRGAPTEAFYLDPEPAHAKWEYYESQVTEGQAVVPEFHCLMLRGEWWVVDVDREREMYQQVAALEFADNPNHGLNRFRDNTGGPEPRPGDIVVRRR